MNTFQWVMIGLAVFLVAPVIWKQLKNIIPERKPIELPPPPLQINEDHQHTDLIDVVECWQHLIDCCKANGMNEAADEIYKVFPLFANKGVDNE